MKIKIPECASEILKMLADNGYEGYLVGGSVRDILLGKEPHDIDIASNAVPERVMEIFGGNAYPTGLQHGTVTVKTAHGTAEITTYRKDYDYEDHRHPTKVAFSETLADDISRRDFTVNAIAADMNGDITDLCGGLDDLHNKFIRCVGEPSERFDEDALRIMRAIRFAAVLGFEIEERTAAAVHAQKALLNAISIERITEELRKFLLGRGIDRLMIEFSDVFAEIIPEFEPCIGFDQMSEYHIYTVYDHIAHAAGNSVPDPYIRTALFLHDIEKPSVCTFRDGHRHFKGHEAAGAETAEKILRSMRFDNRTINEAVWLIANHGLRPKLSAPPSKEDIINIREMISQMGYERYFRLIRLSMADNSAKSPKADARIAMLKEMERIGKEIQERGECVSISQLAVNGRDLLETGLKGEEIGAALDMLLDKVIKEEVGNNKAALLDKVKNRD